jgi:organic hydroperoxide reductase OsmC/OhrA
MATQPGNDLAASGLPVFFPLGNAAERLSQPRNPHGRSVRVWARSLSVMQKEAVVLSAATGKAWRLASDEGPYLDGFDAAPCPLSFVSTGMVSMFMRELLALAASRGIQIRDLELVQDNFYTMQGSALRGTMTGGALPVQLRMNVASDAQEPLLQALVQDAIAAAPVSALLRGEHPSAFSLQCNGEPVVPVRVRSIPLLPEQDPGQWMGGGPVGATGSAPIERLVPAAQVEGVAGGAHTSLAETQQRRLHVQVTCRQRAAGVFEVEQRLFSPIGSTFRFLCDPAGVAAPDPESYVAAGIAFCFMTQLGRYASILKKNLAAYNVIQDLHLPQQGSGPALPVQTHVYLTTSEDAEFARSALAMGEQTCFLHALCRTDVAVESSVAVTRS